MEFEITPGRADITTNRNLALISLHHDFTKYLEEINERVRPIELPLMNFREVGDVYYYLRSGWQDQIISFAKEFESKYPEVEQVYVFSRYNLEKIPTSDYERIYRIDSVSNALGKGFASLIMKRFLTIEYPNRKEWYQEHSLSKSFIIKEKFISSDEEIKRTVERSLRFNSW